MAAVATEMFPRHPPEEARGDEEGEVPLRNQRR
jgi:hypothetical protein